jgi:dTDP-4-dehydrorhamnose reductase
MILLLGATGYLGRAFAAELRSRRLDFIPLTRSAVDYSRFDVLFNYVRKSKPQFVINAAGNPGNPNIDACEVRRADTLQANTLLPQTLARVCYLTQTPWGHVSSGCIFSGAKIAQNGSEQVERDLSRQEIRNLFATKPELFRGFAETDAPNCSFRSPPCSFYSGTKALAEDSLRWVTHNYIWRPGIIFDEFDHPRNYLSKIQNYSKVLDSVNSFTHRGDFVRACIEMWERRAPFGTYNVVNPGAASARQITAAIQRALTLQRAFEFWESDEEFYRLGAAAYRPASILDSSKLLAAGIQMRPLQNALEDSLKKWQPSPQDNGWMAEALKARK